MKKKSKDKVFRTIKEIRDYYSQKEDDKSLRGKSRYYKLGVKAASAALSGS